MIYYMKCAKCGEEFPESELELSHDIPKYLGGTDLNGRHYLCKKHHKKYELLILKKCLKLIGEELKSEDFEEVKSWQIELLKQSERLKEKFREIAKQIKEEWFNG